MIRISPSLLSADFTRLGEEVKAAEAAGADMLHIDVMDGHFVPNITIGPAVVSAINRITDLPLDVHLMIEDPDKFLPDFLEAGADYLTVHAEASTHLHRTVHWIKERGIKAGVSINPATPIWYLDDILPDLDMVLLMSVNPGFGGQVFIQFVLEKVKAVKEIIKQKKLDTLIEIDGGVKLGNAKEIADAGADILVMGSAFFGSGDYAGLMKKFRGLIGQK